MRKIKLLVWGDAVVPTGFSRVLHSIIKYLPMDKYEVHWIGINFRGDPHPYSNLSIYPAVLEGDLYGKNRFDKIASYVNPDIIFLLNDVWLINDLLRIIKDFYNRKGTKLPKIVTYFPVDAEEHDSDWYKNLDVVTPVVYTEFGKKVAQKAAPLLDFKIIPHGVEQEIFGRIANKSKLELRNRMYPSDETARHEDTFVIFNGNRNQPRKRIAETIEAFKLFSENKPLTVKLYLHMGIIDASIDIIKLTKRLGIDNRLLVTTLFRGPQQVSDIELNNIYNIADVGVNTSLGEGWGLVNVEHAVTGGVQVVPDHSACSELFRDCGLLVPVKRKFVMDKMMTVGGLVDPIDVATAFETLYTDRELLRKLSELSRVKYLSPEFSWKNISETWEKLFRVSLDTEDTSKVIVSKTSDDNDNISNQH